MVTFSFALDRAWPSPWLVWIAACGLCGGGPCGFYFPPICLWIAYDFPCASKIRVPNRAQKARFSFLCGFTVQNIAKVADFEVHFADEFASVSHDWQPYQIDRWTVRNTITLITNHCCLNRLTIHGPLIGNSLCSVFDRDKFRPKTIRFMYLV